MSGTGTPTGARTPLTRFASTRPGTPSLRDVVSIQSLSFIIFLQCPVVPPLPPILPILHLNPNTLDLNLHLLPC